MDFSALLQSAPQLFRDMPLIINMVQLVFYAGFALTFGGYVMKGYRGFISGRMRLLGRLAFGTLAVMCGIGISWAFPFFSEAYIYQIMQTLFINVIIGGILATAVLFTAVRLASHNIFNVPGIDRAIENLKKLKKNAKEVEKSDMGKKRQGIRHPVRMAGVAVLAVFLVFSLAGFRGFPSPMEELGFSQGDLENMADQMDQISGEYGDQLEGMLSPECMGAVDVLQDQASLEQARSYSSPTLEQAVREQTGEEVSSMIMLDSGEDTYVVSMTSNYVCISTLDSLCLCRENGSQA